MVSAFSSRVRYDEWSSFESRVGGNVDRILDILEEQKVQATFFVLGWVGEKNPDVVRRIVRRGHEIACHGYRHSLVYDLEQDAFREDTRKAKRILEDLAGAPVSGYRAPSFSITKRSIWALDILVEEGFKYDSSVYPVRHDRYGVPGFSRFPVSMQTEKGNILEVPPPSLRLLGMIVPFGGGGYFRHFPLWFTDWGIRRVNRREREGVVVYLHPWELDPDQPRIPCGRITGFRHYRNQHKTESRLRTLLRRHRFSSFRSVFAHI
ncbi:MAG TPA: polysaccharide deacetylase family protein [Deltaproteobacteria bacterium]|nr:polysaccharide deacetylase family protein [Deltaproteobacteria bacterium]